jgi:hypothetical protein
LTREQAIRKLKAIIGPRAMWRVSEGISSPEKRQRYHARTSTAEADRKAASAAMSARAAEVCAADAEYQRLKASYDEARKAASETRYRDDESGYKFTVGKDAVYAFVVEAQGDTWEEVISKLEQQKVKRSA